MKKINSKLLVCALYFVLMCFLVGCGNDSGDVFTQVAAQPVAEPSVRQSSGGATVSLLSLPEMWYNASVYIKRWAPVVIIGSLLIGWIIYDIFKKVKEVQKWAFDFLIIRIPIFTFLFVYAYSFLYRMLNM